MEEESGHPGADRLERLLRGELPRTEFALVVRHLLTRCPECLEVARALWELGDSPKPRWKLRMLT